MGAGPLRGQVPLTALGPDDVLSAVSRCVWSVLKWGDVLGPRKKMALRNGFHWGHCFFLTGSLYKWDFSGG